MSASEKLKALEETAWTWKGMTDRVDYIAVPISAYHSIVAVVEASERVVRLREKPADSLLTALAALDEAIK